MKVLEEVCKVSYRALERAKGEVKPGARLLDVAVSLEDYIRGEGYGLAFPVNISLNSEAAHYTPSYDDEKVFGEDVVKIDLGAEKEGVLGDCAATIDLSGKNGDLTEASKLALDNAIASIKAGVEIGSIGAEIERTISSSGFNPIMNLGGHGIGVNDLHSEPFIPNYDNGDGTPLEEGMVIAIEPFATTGIGSVVSGSVQEIFSFAGEALFRSLDARKLYGEVKSHYPHNPFALRWVAGLFGSKFSLYAAVNELLRAGAIVPHPVLVESSSGVVSQHEATVVVEKGGCRVLTA